MNTKSKIVLALVLLTTLAALALPAAAQTDTRTLTLAEEQINQSYRVTASPRRSVDNTYVDLQPGQVVISATLTFRHSGPYDTTTTLVPVITDGRLSWNVIGVTAGGQEASADLLSQINAAIESSWRSYVQQQAGTGRIVAVDITDDTLTITYEGRTPDNRTPPSGRPTPDNTPGILTFTEAQINDSYRVIASPRRSVDDTYVDLQSGQVVISATITLRGQDPVATATTLLPSLENGRIFWTVQSILADGAPASADLVAQVNAAIASSWRSYVRQQVPGHVTAFELTEDALTCTLALSR